jgi:membrane-bound lytic murein transglycosylase D
MKVSFPSLFVVLLVISAPTFAAERAELPATGLENRVEFWKKIFTQYGKDDIVIHDRVRVNLIYDVADESNVETKLTDVDHALKAIQASVDTPDSELSLTAKQIRDAIVAADIPLTKSSLDQLIENVHTQRGIKERFREGVVRSGRYVDTFRKIMENEGVIPELALLPLVESSFQNAKSKAAALGVWQFTRSTGKLYMNINKKGDDRLDPLKSTRAAARLLHENYSALGSWPLAITAYNHGRGGMIRAKSEIGPDLTKIISDYRGPVFGYASMNFYTEFLAAVDVWENYQQYFGELVLDRPAPGSVPKLVVASTKATSTKATPTKAKTTLVASKTTSSSRSASKYKVRNGDTLYEIAQKFGTSIRELMAKNNLSRPHIYAGQILLVK